VIRNEEGHIIDGCTVVANDAAIRYTGLTHMEMLSKTILEVEPDMLKGPIYTMALQTLNTGVPFHTQYQLQSTGKWLELSVAKMDDNHLINAFLDITITKEAQLLQERLLDELKRSNASLEEFAYAASHDLKEPIRKIHFFSGRLKEQHSRQLDEKGLHILNRLEVAAERMEQLVDDLLTYSQLNIKPHTPELVDLNENLGQVMNDLELEVETKKAKITIGSLPTVNGYSRQLQQLFQNLLSNAIKYSKPGVLPEVTVSAQKILGKASGAPLPSADAGKWFYQVKVEDNGIGFSQQDAERIFNVFTRLHGNAEYKGTGVGLSIAKKVAENHQGYIWAESAPGQGTTFKVLLPVV
jgi:light-regulated signal transduction histidine kinase (bacteriophytochrome)